MPEYSIEDTLRAIVENTETIERYLADEMISEACQEVNRRESLIQRLGKLVSGLGHASGVKEFPPKDELRSALQSLLSRNEDTLKKLGELHLHTKKKLNIIKKGRKTLGLYRKPDLRQARIISCVG
jgi:hypothetical protein